MESLTAEGWNVAGEGAQTLVVQSFDVLDLCAVRSAVAEAATRLGLSGKRISALVLVVAELTTNAVRHGGGTGQLELWSADHQLHCVVTDQGTGIPSGKARVESAPSPAESSGRGIWLVRMLTDSISIMSSPAGTSIHATMVIG